MSPPDPGIVRLQHSTKQSLPIPCAVSEARDAVSYPSTRSTQCRILSKPPSDRRPRRAATGSTEQGRSRRAEDAQNAKLQGMFCSAAGQPRESHSIWSQQYGRSQASEPLRQNHTQTHSLQQEDCILNPTTPSKSDVRCQEQVRLLGHPSPGEMKAATEQTSSHTGGQWVGVRQCHSASSSVRTDGRQQHAS